MPANIKISIVSLPLVGHLGILAKLAKSLVSNHPFFQVKIILTEFNNFRLNSDEAEKIKLSGMELVRLVKTIDAVPQKMLLSWPRTLAFADDVIEACRGSDYIIYTYLSHEGYIAASVLNLPAICSIPAIMGSFDPKSEIFQQQLKNDIADIRKLERKYNLSVVENLEMTEGLLYLPSAYSNILWTRSKFLEVTNYHLNRKFTNYVFLRPKPTLPMSWDPLVVMLRKISKDKKIIYLSLGTIVTGIFWDKYPDRRDFIKKIFKDNIKRFGEDEKVEVIISTGRKLDDIFHLIPSNFHVYEQVNQEAVLHFSDVFITHGGGNSVNEAIDAGVPMVVIPFFADQFLSANNVARLGIGISLFGVAKLSAVDQNTNPLNVMEINETNDALQFATDKILSDDSYKTNIKALATEECVPEAMLGRMLFPSIMPVLPAPSTLKAVY